MAERQRLYEVRRDKHFAQISRRFFNRASEREFASNTKQGALLATFCKRFGYKPDVLSKALLADEDELGKVRTAAIARHRGNPNAPQADVLTLERVGWTVEANFIYARDFMVLDMAQLEKILNYPLTPVRNQANEDLICDFAYSLVPEEFLPPDKQNRIRDISTRAGFVPTRPKSS